MNTSESTYYTHHERKERKYSKLHGQEYINKKGEVVPVKKASFCGNCKNKNHIEIDEDVAARMFKEYYNLGSYEKQSNYLLDLIEIKHMNNRKANSSKKFEMTYNIRYGDVLQPVCMKSFLRIFDITERKLRIILKKAQENKPLCDLRGINKRGNKEKTITITINSYDSKTKEKNPINGGHPSKHDVNIIELDFSTKENNKNDSQYNTKHSIKKNHEEDVNTSVYKREREHKEKEKRKEKKKSQIEDSNMEHSEGNTSKYVDNNTLTNEKVVAKEKNIKKHAIKEQTSKEFDVSTESLHESKRKLKKWKKDKNKPHMDDSKIKINISTSENDIDEPYRENSVEHEPSTIRKKKKRKSPMLHETPSNSDLNEYCINSTHGIDEPYRENSVEHEPSTIRTKKKRKSQMLHETPPNSDLNEYCINSTHEKENTKNTENSETLGDNEEKKKEKKKKRRLQELMECEELDIGNAKRNKIKFKSWEKNLKKQKKSHQEAETQEEFFENPLSQETLQEEEKKRKKTGIFQHQFKMSGKKDKEKEIL